MALFAMLVFDATRGMLLAFTAGATTDLIARVVVAAGYFGTVLALAWRRSWVLVPFGLTLAGALLTSEERGVFLPLAIILAVAAYALTTWPLVVMVVSSVAWELAWRVLHDAVNGRLLWPVPFVLLLVLPGRALRVPPGLLPTAVTVLREATTNIVKHSSPGVRCELAIAIGDELTIEVLNELSEGLLDLPESGLGLAGLRGRMSDLHGTFRSGEHNGWWTVYATLPLHERE